MTGIDARQLSDEDLHRELESLYTTRLETLRHGSEAALSAHSTRVTELENDYLRRHPQREIDPDRLRSGARAR